ncbi:MAG: D-aminoacyl-tRNA deacylase [Desulfovibrionaceae bacterium]
MRLLLQRVRQAQVVVDEVTVGEIGPGLLVLVGFGKQDGPGLPDDPVWGKMIDKMIGLRIFPDTESRMNRSLADVGGDLLLVSQFTLHADCRKGRRPSFTNAADPAVAQKLFERLAADAADRAPGRTEQGLFGELMDVSLTNWGPVTIMLRSEDLG